MSDFSAPFLLFLFQPEPHPGSTHSTQTTTSSTDTNNNTTSLPVSYSAKLKGGLAAQNNITTSNVSRPSEGEEKEGKEFKKSNSKANDRQEQQPQSSSETEEKPFPDLSVSLDFLKTQPLTSSQSSEGFKERNSDQSNGNGNGFGTIGSGSISASSSTNSPWAVGGGISSPGIAPPSSSTTAFSSSARPIPFHSHSHSISSNHSSSSFSSSIGTGAGGGSPSFSDSRQGRPTFPDTQRRTSFFADESDPVHLPSSPRDSGSSRREASRSREPVSRILADHQINPSSNRSNSPSRWDLVDSSEHHHNNLLSRSRSASASGSARDSSIPPSSFRPIYNPSQSQNGNGDSHSVYSSSSGSSSIGSHFSSGDHLNNGINGKSTAHQNQAFTPWNEQNPTFESSSWKMNQNDFNREESRDGSGTGNNQSPNVNGESHRESGYDSASKSPAHRFTKRSQSAQAPSTRGGSGLESENTGSNDQDGLATMHEEWERRENEGRGGDHEEETEIERERREESEGGTKTARASPQQRATQPLTSPTPRQSRSRSNSSAPALALHMTSNQPRRDQGFSPWGEGAVLEQSRFGYGMNGEDDRDGGPTPKTPRSPSQANRRAQPVSMRGGFEDLGNRGDHSNTHSNSNSFDRALGYSNISPFMREGGLALLNDLERHQGGRDEDYHQAPFLGTESRRHSIAAAPPASHEVVPSSLNQRRAVGFEVSGNGPSGGGSWQSRASSAQPQPRSGGGYGMFGGGSMAISADDLADGSGNGLQLNAQPQQQHQNIRVPSNNAAATGAHAASMPPYFGERDLDAFGYANENPRDYSDPYQGGGRSQQPIGSTASSWDISSPLSPSNNNRNDSADVSGRRFRAMSMGIGAGGAGYDAFAVGSLNHGNAHSQFGGRALPSSHHHHMEDSPDRLSSRGRGRTDSMSTSSEIDRTHSPSGSSASGQSGRHQLSPRAQAFQIANAAPPSARQNSQNQYVPPGRNNDSPSSSYHHQQQQMQQHQRILPPHSASNPAPGFLPPPPSAELGLAGTSHLQQQLPPLPLFDPTSMNDLATLGPMAPLGGGPNLPGGFGYPGGVEPASLQDMGKGVPLQTLNRDMILYIVEFKQGRTDLYFKQSENDRGGYHQQDETIRKGDLVIVEADRGRDLGTVVNE